MKIITLLTSILIFSSSIGQEKYTLEDFIGEVLANDFGINIMKKEYQIAQNENNIGAAGYLPRISIDAQQDLTINTARLEFLSGDVNEAQNARNTGFNTGAFLEWTFFDGFKMFATDKKLDYLEETAQLNLRAEMEMKVYEASIAFYTLLLLQEMKEVYEQSIELSKNRYDYIERRLNNGAATKIELIQAQLDLTADSASYLSNLREIEEVSSSMNTLLTRSPDSPIQAEGSLPKPDDQLSWEALKEKANTQNTSILLAKSNIAIRDKEQKEVKSRYYPQLGFYAAYNFARSENEIGFLRTNRAYGPSVGLTLRWDILDQLSRYSGMKNAKLQIETSELQEKQEKIFIESELRRAYVNYNWSEKNINFELRNQLAIEEIVKATEQAFETGAISPLELREVQFGIVEARSRLLATQLDYITAKLNIALTVGDFGNMM